MTETSDESGQGLQASERYLRKLIKAGLMQSALGLNFPTDSAHDYNFLVRETVFIRIGDHRWLGTSITSALVTELLSHTPAAAFAAGVVPEVLSRVRLLRPHELRVLAVIKLEVGNKAIYRVWIDEERLLEAIGSDLDQDEKRRTLATMKGRGILEEGAGKWRVVW